jgi:hypothetical protein
MEGEETERRQLPTRMEDRSFILSWNVGLNLGFPAISTVRK